MISVDLDQIRADFAALMSHYVGHLLSRALYESFYHEFHDLLEKHDLKIDVVIPRPTPGERTINVQPVHKSDAIVLYYILSMDRQG